MKYLKRVRNRTKDLSNEFRKARNFHDLASSGDGFGIEVAEWQDCANHAKPSEVSSIMVCPVTTINDASYVKKPRLQNFAQIAAANSQVVGPVLFTAPEINQQLFANVLNRWQRWKDQPPTGWAIVKVLVCKKNLIFFLYHAETGSVTPVKVDFTRAMDLEISVPFGCESDQQLNKYIVTIYPKQDPETGETEYEVGSILSKQGDKVYSRTISENAEGDAVINTTIADKSLLSNKVETFADVEAEFLRLSKNHEVRRNGLIIIVFCLGVLTICGTLYLTGFTSII